MAEGEAERRSDRADITARLKSLATAVPPYRLPQDEIRAMAREIFRPRMPDFDRLETVFANAGVAERRSSVPLAWFRDAHGWPDRNGAYQAIALDLLEEVASDALEQAGLLPEEIRGVVCVSTTGIATPSLDAMLMRRLAFPDDVVRLPLFGFGCGGGALGLARAGMLAEALPGQRWLGWSEQLSGCR